MNEVFADIAYLAALLSKDDDLHELALLQAEDLGKDQTSVLVTTDAVLIELLSLFSGRGAEGREAAASLAQELLDSPSFVVLPQTRDRVRSAHRLYAERLDKEWSGVDCLSIVVMNERGITRVLTHDHHFEQAGLTRLL
jgi:predicted nucleic acid-binding protein